MGSPSPVLAKAFDTGRFKMAAATDWKPLKGGLPLAALLGSMLLYSHFKGGVQDDLAEGQVRADGRRMAEAQRNAGMTSGLAGRPVLDPLASMTYLRERSDSAQAAEYPFAELDKGAAAHASEAGRALAKNAGLGGVLMKGLGAINKAPDLIARGASAVAKPVVSRLPGPTLKQKALIGAGVVGGGLLAAKAGRKAMEFGMEPAQDRRQGAPGPVLPRYVNQWGQPTLA